MGHHDLSHYGLVSELEARILNFNQRVHRGTHRAKPSKRAWIAKADPLDYLTELQKHLQDLTQKPQDWIPWNYRQTLDRPVQPSDRVE